VRTWAKSPALWSHDLAKLERWVGAVPLINLLRNGILGNLPGSVPDTWWEPIDNPALGMRGSPGMGEFSFSMGAVDS
jgi:hypothetical protein